MPLSPAVTVIGGRGWRARRKRNATAHDGSAPSAPSISALFVWGIFPGISFFDLDLVRFPDCPYFFARAADTSGRALVACGGDDDEADALCVSPPPFLWYTHRVTTNRPASTNMRRSGSLLPARKIRFRVRLLALLILIICSHRCINRILNDAMARGSPSYSRRVPGKHANEDVLILLRPPPLHGPDRGRRWAHSRRLRRRRLNARRRPHNTHQGSINTVRARLATRSKCELYFQPFASPATDTVESIGIGIAATPRLYTHLQPTRYPAPKISLVSLGSARPRRQLASCR